MKINYVTKVDHTLLLKGETRSPTAGFASSVEYTVLELDVTKNLIKIEMKSNSAPPYIYDSTMEGFGKDILIVPDWNYWRINVSEKLASLSINNPSNTSVTTTIIDENNIYGYQVEIKTFNTELKISKTEIMEYTYEKSQGVLNYRRLYFEQEFIDESREISETVTKLETNHDDYKSNDLDQSYLKILILIFTISVTASVIFNQIKKRKTDSQSDNLL